MPKSLESFCSDIVSGKTQMKVTDSNRYPQFKLYDIRGSVLVSLTADNDIDNANSGNTSGVRGFFAKIAEFFNSLFTRIKNLFKIK